MSANVIKKAISVGQAVSNGVPVSLKVAVETSDWTRPASVAEAQGPALKKAVESSTKPLPANTATIISRDADHKSAGDQKDHITAVAYDAKGKRIETIHIDTPKKN